MQYHARDGSLREKVGQIAGLESMRFLRRTGAGSDQERPLQSS